MATYKIPNTTIKERALLTYNNISYEYLSEEYSIFPIKDITVTSERSLLDVLKAMRRCSITMHDGSELDVTEPEKSVIG